MSVFNGRNRLCPSCASSRLFLFYEIEDVPVNSVLLLQSRDEALSFPRGDISLALCLSCGFIFNLMFNPRLLEYSVRYEATQSYSPSFNVFHRNLAERLIERYDLNHKNIIEIGCGQGEFLKLLCEGGKNQGIGFDPVYDESRSELAGNNSVKIIKDFYSEKYAHIPCDFICCKMTLEHIQNTGEFIGNIAYILRDKPNTIVFFQVPDTARILHENAFWDIYYEHCSYFSLGSLARLFRQHRFDIIDLEKDYGEQYLMITARSGTGTSPKIGDDLFTIERDAEHFVNGCQASINEWRQKLSAYYQAGQRTILWGASSKAVAFLTTLKLEDEISYAVDINPLKAGTYIAGTGHKIVSPEFLVDDKPDIVIAMNPVYTREIGEILRELGVNAQLLSI